MSVQKQYRFNAGFAIFFGLALIIVETIRRYGDWGHWSRWSDDYFMGSFLIISAILLLKHLPIGKPMLIGAWGFNAGLLYGSFFSKYTASAYDFQSNIEPALMISLIGLAFGTSLLAFIWILWLEYISNLNSVSS